MKTSLYEFLTIDSVDHNDDADDMIRQKMLHKYSSSCVCVYICILLDFVVKTSYSIGAKFRYVLCHDSMNIYNNLYSSIYIESSLYQGHFVQFIYIY